MDARTLDYGTATLVLMNDTEQNPTVMTIPHQLMLCPGISTNQLPGRDSSAGIKTHDVVDRHFAQPSPHAPTRESKTFSQERCRDVAFLSRTFDAVKMPDLYEQHHMKRSPDHTLY